MGVYESARVLHTRLTSRWSIFSHFSIGCVIVSLIHFSLITSDVKFFHLILSHLYFFWLVPVFSFVNVSTVLFLVLTAFYKSSLYFVCFIKCFLLDCNLSFNCTEHLPRRSFVVFVAFFEDFKH